MDFEIFNTCESVRDLGGNFLRARHALAGLCRRTIPIFGLPEGGQVQELITDRGKIVLAGDHLLSLESGLQEAVLAGATAALQKAKADLDNLLKGGRKSEITAIEERLTQAMAERELATVYLTRQKDLVENGVASVETLDSAQAAFISSRARVREIEAQLVTAQLEARVDEIAAAEAVVAGAMSTLAEANWRLAQRRLYAPDDGLIADIYYRAGEYVSAGRPTLSFLAHKDRKIRFFVPETALSLISPGMQVSVDCDNCGDGLAATINFISPEAEFTPPIIFSETVRHKLVFLVEAIPNAPLAILAPGLPVDVRLLKDGPVP